MLRWIKTLLGVALLTSAGASPLLAQSYGPHCGSHGCYGEGSGYYGSPGGYYGAPYRDRQFNDYRGTHHRRAGWGRDYVGSCYGDSCRGGAFYEGRPPCSQGEGSRFGCPLDRQGPPAQFEDERGLNGFGPREFAPRAGAAGRAGCCDQHGQAAPPAPGAPPRQFAPIRPDNQRDLPATPPVPVPGLPPDA